MGSSPTGPTAIHIALTCGAHSNRDTDCEAALPDQVRAVEQEGQGSEHSLQDGQQPEVLRRLQADRKGGNQALAAGPPSNREPSPQPAGVLY